MAKECFKCRVSKAIDEFYRQPHMNDGHQGKCKDCAKADVRANRAANIDRIREYDRMRGLLPHRLAANRVRAALPSSRAANRERSRRYRKTHSKRVGETQKLARAKHPNRAAAHLRAERHHRKAPDSCQMCGLVKSRLERHHPDYNLPLMIVWLCKPCHYIADCQRRENENTG